MPTSRTSAPATSADGGGSHLILVGLPGSGKTTVGRAVAERLGRRFLDLDEEIVRRESMSISEIFATHGEGHFRGLERQLTIELRGTGGLVVAPGGGWITNPELVALVRPPSRLVYLRVQPATALSRLGPERLSRPLLQGEHALQAMTGLLEQRHRQYEASDVVVDSETLSLQQVIDELVRVESES